MLGKGFRLSRLPLNIFFLRLRDSYKRFVKTWIRFANPWIRTVSWITNPDFKRFVSYRGSRILTLKDSFWIVSHESSQFSKIRPFLRFANPNLKDSYRGFVLWKHKSRITWFVSIRKATYTNPASLIFFPLLFSFLIKVSQ